MLLIRPRFEILNHTQFPMLTAEVAGRTCYKSEDKITPDSANDFCRHLIRSGHESVLEHVTVTVRIICSRSVSHRLVRHRIASYSQESTRWINYGKRGNVPFIIPVWSEGIQEDMTKVMTSSLTYVEKEWIEHMAWCEKLYKKMLNGGMKPEDAQGVLPHDLKTEIVVTQNIRQWRHFFKERTAKCAGEQMRQITVPMLVLFHDKFPVMFEDILDSLRK